MAQGGLTARITLVDADGNEVGGADVPLEVSSDDLKSAINSLTEVLLRVEERLAIVMGQL